MSGRKRQQKTSSSEDYSDDESDVLTEDENKFHDHFITLIALLRAVQNERHAKSKTIVPVKKGIAEYLRHYSKTRPDIHMERFETIYSRFKADVLKSFDEEDCWLLDQEEGPVMIVNKPGSSFINLTVCYKDSLLLKNNDATDEWSSYPDAILYELYNIFLIVCPASDKRKLTRIVKELEKLVDKDLINKLSRPQSKSSSFSSTSGPADPSAILSELQSGSFDIGSILNNPAIKGIMGPMIEQMKNTFENGNIKTPSDAFRSLSDVFENPEIAKVLSEGLPETAQLAINSAQETTPEKQS